MTKPRYDLHRVTNPMGATVELNCTRRAALRFARFGPVLVASWDDATDRRVWVPVGA